MRTPGDFRATLGGVTITDRATYDAAMSRPVLRRGLEVTFPHDGAMVTGQVWDSAPGGWWVQGDDGHTYLVRRPVSRRRDVEPGPFLRATRVDTLGRPA